MNTQRSREFLPAAGKRWLLPLYDPVVKWLGGEAARLALLEDAAPCPGQRVLDLGCGTGTLAIKIKQRFPEIQVAGIDPDADALERARKKASRAGVSVQFDQGFGDELPYPTHTFDRVLSSFVFHHIPADQKPGVLQAARRVLKVGGTFHLADFEGRDDLSQPGFLSRLLHHHAHMKDNSERRVLQFLEQAGFTRVLKIGRRHTIFGHVAYYRATAE